jgi:hypothetical protein
MTQQDAVLVSLLAYACLHPEEALALVCGDIAARHIRVERAVALGEIREGWKTRGPTRKRHDRRTERRRARRPTWWTRLGCGRPRCRPSAMRGPAIYLHP